MHVKRTFKFSETTYAVAREPQAKLCEAQGSLAYSPEWADYLAYRNEREARGAA